MADDVLQMCQRHGIESAVVLLLHDINSESSALDAKKVTCTPFYTIGRQAGFAVLAH